MTPSNSVSFSRYWWYMRVSLVMADGMSGKPLWMASNRLHIARSVAVAVRTPSHVTDLMSSVAVDAQFCEQRGCAVSSRERRAARISLDRHVGGSVECVAAATSSGKSGDSASPTGCRDKASAKVLRKPGMRRT